MMEKFKFIDLFSGIGGFHQAMVNLGGKCVFASEIDKEAIKTYQYNYGIDSAHDITKTKEEDIPKHDVLCAGFPCQAFSKAGQQLGFTDKTKGTLFFEIIRILKYHKTPYIILENVRNLTSHDNGKTWIIIKNALNEIGYIISEDPFIISPHQLGIPQLRERVIILGVHKDVGIKNLNITLPNYDKKEIIFFNSGILEQGDVDKKYYISKHQEKVLQCWDEFIKGIKYIPSRKTDRRTKKKSYIKINFNGTIGFPIWAFEFRETYDYSNEKYEWKKDFIAKNRYLYQFNKRFIDAWLKKWNVFDSFTPTEQKLEWQCGSECTNVWDGLIQFRPSGVRVKTATVFPALVAMVQIPIIGKVKRRLTPREAARLQSFPDDFIINSDDHQAYKQFGNAVNVNVIQYMAEQLFKQK